METVRVFVGYDERESVAFHTLAHSIWYRASLPVSITPVALHQLTRLHDRPRERFQSNDFTFSRWLVPYLCGYEGWAIFMDCDMLVRRDIAELWSLRDGKYAVQCVKHDYVPAEREKYLGNEQDSYTKKNWSSVMLMHCGECLKLTPGYVNSATRMDLHQFKWLDGDHLIGEIPREWNYLADYGQSMPDAALVHFTKGGPYFDEYRGVEFTEEWEREVRMMTHCEQMKRGIA